MTARNPLVRVLGKIVELPVGDTIAGAPAGSNGTNGTGTNGTGLALISTVVTSGSQSTVTFSSIATTWTKLLIEIQGRDTTAGTSNVDVYIMFNGDNTAANYDAAMFLSGNSTTASSGNLTVTAKGIPASALIANGATAGATGYSVIEIPNYHDTTWWKVFMSRSYNRIGTTPTKVFYDEMGTWKNTAAITSVTISATLAFVNGTIVSLFGMG